MAKVRAGRMPRALSINPQTTERIVFDLTTALSQTAVNALVYTPGYKFRVARVRTYCLNKAGNVSGNVLVGPVAGTLRTSAALVFTAATEVGATPSTTVANVDGSATEQLVVQYTSDGAGVLTNGVVVIEIIPQASFKDSKHVSVN